MAKMCGFGDEYTLRSVSRYLEMNGDLTIKPVSIVLCCSFCHLFCFTIHCPHDTCSILHFAGEWTWVLFLLCHLVPVWLHRWCGKWRARSQWRRKAIHPIQIQITAGGWVHQDCSGTYTQNMHVSPTHMTVLRYGCTFHCFCRTFQCSVFQKSEKLFREFTGEIAMVYGVGDEDVPGPLSLGNYCRYCQSTCWHFQHTYNPHPQHTYT